MKKLLALVLTLTCLLSLTSVGAVGDTVAATEVYASKYYMSYMWGNFTEWSIWGLDFFGRGTVDQGVLTPSVITGPEDDRNNGNYMVTDMMVFTFDEEVSLSSMTFTSISDGEFPTEYQIQYRDADYYSEAYGFTGNPSEGDIAAGENWPSTEGFGPEGGLMYTEVSREGDTVTIQLDEPVECVAIMIQAITNGETPWSCEEAHFFGEIVEKEPSDDPSEDIPEPVAPVDPKLWESVKTKIYASKFYHVAMRGNFSIFMVWPLYVFGQGTVNDGVLDSPTITWPNEKTGGYGNNGNYMMTDMMVFTFDEPTVVTSMTFQSISDGEFPTEYQIQYRDAEYYSEAHGFTGNPSEEHIAAGENWPITEGFGPEGGLAYTEVLREGDTVAIELDEPVECVAIMIQAITKGETPWSCEEAHFYGEVAEEEPPEDPVRILGDVNGDGRVGASDATRVLLAAVGKITLTTNQHAAADISGDGRVGALDATQILLHAVGKRLIES